jgi:lysophospholipase L1-like esterase
MHRTVLCYGDSNTYGAAVVPRPDNRYCYEERWPGVLAGSLGPTWLVIEEGLNGRTTVRDDPVEGEFRNGKNYLLPCLCSHMPLDLVAIMLGTNDLKTRFNASPWDIAQGLGSLISIVRSAAAGRGGGSPEILVIAPPPLLDTLPLDAEMFVGGREKSMQLAGQYAALARRLGTRFFDAGSVARASPTDGLHLEPEAHRALGLAVAVTVREIFG